MDFYRFDKEQDEISNLQLENSLSVDNISNEAAESSVKLEELRERINAIANKIDKTSIDLHDTECEKLNEYIAATLPNRRYKTSADMRYNMQPVDYIIASCIGGLAALVDAFLVKIPTDTSVVRNKLSIKKEGSKLTGILRSIGITPEGKTAGWIETLETYFKVSYDKSVDSDIAGFCPKTHRLHCLAHDPSISGLFWAIKDLISGTMTCIDKDGILHVQKVADSEFSKLLSAPLIWFGHILSDVFTKMGIPIPGWSYLQLFQFGSFGEKERTIADFARYMYLKGYDLRHLLTMSTVNVIVEVLIHLYLFLTQEKPNEEFLISEKEYKKIKEEIKKRNIHFIAYSVATCGNIGKIIAYQGTPTAFNLPLWYGMIKEAVGQCLILTRSSKEIEEVIEGRHVIDENFDYLNSFLQDNNK